MVLFTDQMGRTITLEQRPKRIISIVPSQTELLFDLGLNNEVAGITKFCIHPEEMFRTKPRVGGTKKLDFEKIRSLKPDLIIGNKEENQQEQVEELMKEFPVWMSDIYTLDDSLRMIRAVGEVTGKDKESERITHNIRQGFDELKSSALMPPDYKLKTAYFIWKDPYMLAGGNTFIDHMLQLCCFENAFANTLRYPSITEDDLRAAAPSLILLSSEPYPFKEKHIEEFRAICPSAKVMVVDGEMFSWYGSRLQHAPAYLSSLVKDIFAQ
jgi:ABC-type Fe3+-hydroxamate transport system substrate-binding protein